MSMDNPRTQAEREAAQRADEAELLTYDQPPQIPTYSDHPDGIMGAVVEYLDPALYAEKFPVEHTPGPWRWERKQVGNVPAMVTLNGQPNHWNDPIILAMREDFAQFPYATTNANARLIAAAPALLEACQQVLARLDLEAQERGPDAVFPCAAQRDTLRAAIAQATNTAHTHPCPTCHHDRSCACTGFVPGEPLECATCSNCRGW